MASGCTVECLLTNDSLEKSLNGPSFKNSLPGSHIHGKQIYPSATSNNITREDR